MENQLNGLEIEKTNWAQKIDKGPFKAFPVTGGITFTYGGLKVDKNGSVLDIKDNPIKGLFACGELVGGVFFNGYPWWIRLNLRCSLWKNGWLWFSTRRIEYEKN